LFGSLFGIQFGIECFEVHHQVYARIDDYVQREDSLPRKCTEDVSIYCETIIVYNEKCTKNSLVSLGTSGLRLMRRKTNREAGL